MHKPLHTKKKGRETNISDFARKDISANLTHQSSLPNHTHYIYMKGGDGEGFTSL